MRMIWNRGGIRRRLESRRGTSYVEYFITAAAMGIAAVTLFGKLNSIKEQTYDPVFNQQMDEIAGPLSSG